MERSLTEFNILSRCSDLWYVFQSHRSALFSTADVTGMLVRQCRACSAASRIPAVLFLAILEPSLVGSRGSTGAIYLPAQRSPFTAREMATIKNLACAASSAGTSPTVRYYLSASMNRSVSIIAMA